MSSLPRNDVKVKKLVQGLEKVWHALQAQSADVHQTRVRDLLKQANRLMKRVSLNAQKILQQLTNEIRELSMLRWQPIEKVR